MEEQIIGPGAYSAGDDKLSFKMIVMQHLKKITMISSQEFRGGFWKESIGNKETNIGVKVYITDTREAYTNAVEVLADLLWTHFDKKMKDKEKELNKTLKEQHKEILEGKDYKKLSIEQKKIEISITRRKNRQELFRHINDFLNRKGYMGSVALTDEY